MDPSAIQAKQQMDDEGDGGYRPASGEPRRDANFRREICKRVDEDDEDPMCQRRTEMVDGPYERDLARNQRPKTTLESLRRKPLTSHRRKRLGAATYLECEKQESGERRPRSKFLYALVG